MKALLTKNLLRWVLAALLAQSLVACQGYVNPPDLNPPDQMTTQQPEQLIDVVNRVEVYNFRGIGSQ